MLSAQERAQIAQVWDLIAGHEAQFGAELLLRLFTVYPSTKVYFPHLSSCQDATQLLSHGQRMLAAVGAAVQHMDHLRAALSPLADLHALVLRVDPANFPLLIQCFHVVLASHLQDEFTVEMQAAWDKFLTGVAVVLTEKYR
ncbi:hemoglobin subunit mu [Macaca thibetana thibetana]|uniref:Hemoglobin subunit mu n=4 Tax=Cercopithecinae TaxID=9528 RepID=A0A2K5XF24_MANLE|nr:hemoglobin subunit mu [Macaca fascicularis]XP_011746866.1 hemoglobin subunit mu [Macaca nemestrina]XP_011822261.1 PREDICTED: hemoglobin subunit theta-1 [Mandrillus leucophaeus]XP_025230452.1 hemoglobin subunit mu [Theropithecus gelada]XP_050630725.1 hemoglobin subunit mu [Macaca thibetana thibetana]